MKQSCVSAFARAARTIALTAVVLAVGASTLLAQGSTGKLEGKVRDQQGAPIANAQVIIVGSRFGAQTNADGYYFINNVPAGLVTVQASFIGYKTTRVTDVRVSSGQTITSDVTLESTPIQVDEITVVAAANELVPRDAVTTKQSVGGEYTDKLPVDRIQNVLALQAGVVASASGNTITIRGGRADETAVYIDGVPIRSGNRGNGFVTGGGNAVTVGTNGFEDASVTTGASSAAFGGAQSGIVAISTRTGGTKFNGSAGYESDEPFGRGTSLGFNRITASLGGPIANNLTFFVSGTAEGNKSNGFLGNAGANRDESPYFVPVGVDTVVSVPSNSTPTADTSFVSVQNLAVFTGKCDDRMSAVGLDITKSTNPDIANNFGQECQGIRIPGTATSSYQLQGKLNYSFGTGSRVFVSAVASQNQGRNFTYANISNPQTIFGNSGNNQVYTLGWTQNLAKSAARALALDVTLSYQKDEFTQSPLTRESEASSRDPFGGFMLTPLSFQFDLDNFPLNQELLDNFRQGIKGSRRGPLDLDNTAQYALVDRWRNNAYGVLGFSESGGPTGRLVLNQEDRFFGSAALDWQLDRYNRLKVGGSFTSFDIKSYSSQLVSQAFSDFIMEKPREYAGYAEDRLDLGDVVLVAGLRLDYYDTRASRPQFCNASGCAPTVRISSNPIFQDTTLTLQERLDSIYVEDNSHNYLSPHIQVSFPVSDRTNMRFSYSHQVQPPDYALILGGINTDLSVTNTNHVYGSDLDFGKTISFEFGVRHAFSDDFVLDFSAYNRDQLANVAGRLISLFDPLTQRNQDIRLMTNADFGNARGFDLRLDRRIGNLFNGTLAYTFSDAKNTGSDPFTFINFGSRILNQIAGGNSPPPSAFLPTTFTRPHNLAGSFSLTFPKGWHSGTAVGSIFQDVGVFTTFRVASGTAFTRCPIETGNENVLSTQVCAREFQGDVNGTRLPSFRTIDLKLTKGLRFGGVDLTAYVDGRNIFDFQNVTTVFATTNDIENAVELQEVWAGDSSGFAKEAAASGALDLDTGAMVLPTAISGCGNWVTQDGRPGAPNCVYLFRAEERFGDGDHQYSIAEQRRASAANYYTGRSEANFTSAPRRLRLGMELNF